MGLESLRSFLLRAFANSPLSLSHFNLSVASGIAIFFGGKAAVSALALQPLHGRIWHGWYNAPGCHAIVWGLVRTWLQNSGSSYPEKLSLALGIDSKTGPKYIASQSGTVMQHTRGLARALIDNKNNWRVEEGDSVGRRVSPTPMQLIIVDLKKGTGDDALLQKNHLHSSLHIIPTAASIMACVICFRVRDWLSFTMILLGMVSSGTTSLIMRTGKITHKRGKRGKPADGVPPGDGMLLSDTRIIILRGEEGDVNAVTKGKLRLELKRGYILLCAFIASSQITLQLVIMPFGSLPGQLMFLLSLLVSGASNLYLSAKEDDVRSSALITLLDNPTVKTYRANSRAVAAALACLALYRKPNTPPDQVLEVFKDANIVPVRHPEWWGKWFELVVGNIKRDEWYMSCNRGEGLQAEIIEDAEAAHDRYMRDIEFNLVT